MGSTTVIKASHYMPITVNQATGETIWLESARMPKKFGEEGRLKWMFLLTCNYFSENLNASIFNEMKTDGSLPFGENLHVMCGYTTCIYLETQLADTLGKALLQKIATFDSANLTVVEAWDLTWRGRSQENAEDYIARAVYWPECEGDTILGARVENVTTPTSGPNQALLQFRTFKKP